MKIKLWGVSWKYLLGLFLLGSALLPVACGNNNPTSTNTSTNVPAPTPTFTPPVLTSTPTGSATNTPTSTPTNTATSTPTQTPTNTLMGLTPTYSSNWTYASTSGAYYLAYSSNNSGTIYLANNSSYDVLSWSTSGTVRTTYVGNLVTPVTLLGPVGVAADSAGNVYVSDNGFNNSRVFKFASGGTLTWSTPSGFGSGNGQFNNVGQLGLDGSGDVYIADRANSRVEIISASTGSYVGQWNGSPSHTLSSNFALAVDAANGYVYTASGSTVVKFTTAGVYQTQWTGSISAAQGLAVDPSTGNVLVADDGNNNVQIYNNTGTLLGTAGSYGYGAGQFGASSPDGVAADSGGNLYIGNYSSNEVEVFTP
jgi:hypothetical protein